MKEKKRKTKKDPHDAILGVDTSITMLRLQTADMPKSRTPNAKNIVCIGKKRNKCSMC